MFCCYYLSLFGFVFFFKQKTAYEMRISDWSSDVCSSDLLLRGVLRSPRSGRRRRRRGSTACGTICGSSCVTGLLHGTPRTPGAVGPYLDRRDRKSVV